VFEYVYACKAENNVGCISLSKIYEFVNETTIRLREICCQSAEFNSSETFVWSL